MNNYLPLEIALFSNDQEPEFIDSVKLKDILKEKTYCDLFYCNQSINSFMKSKGYTLIEILVTTTIMVLLAGLAIQITGQIVNIWGRSSKIIHFSRSPYSNGYYCK